MPRPSIIVLAADGLRASALGAYGNTWYGTPALDRLASESLVFDWFHADAPDLPTLYRSLWTGAAPWEVNPRVERSLAEAMAESGYETVLAADDEAVTHAPGADAFGRSVLLEAPSPSRPASDSVETTVASTLAVWLEALEQSPADRPLFAWRHLRFARGPWDAPLSLAEHLLDEDDPRPDDSTAPASGPLDEAADPEFAFESTVRYAAQVMALDKCVGVVTTALDEALGAEGYTLALLGVRGYALGEHGQVGEGDRPYSEARHVPLLIRPPGAERRHRRCHALRASQHFARLLSAELPAPLSDGGGLPSDIVLASPAGTAIQDEHWKLIAFDGGRHELYSKPDDRWEINDVAVRESLVVDELAERLARRLHGDAAS